MAITRNSPTAKPASARPATDFATLFGVAGAFLLVVTAIVLGGTPSAFVDVPAICIVVGGTFGVTVASFSLSEVTLAQKVTLKALIHHERDPAAAARQILQLAQHARVKGLLALQSRLFEVRGERFLYRGLGMVVDGVPPGELEQNMRRELEATSDRHANGSAILRKAGEVSPAMGLIGTLVGLVQMLGGLDNPSTIGPAMAVALLTTFYGAVLAYMVFNPLAAKLERRAEHERLLGTLYLMGVTSIARKENPRRLEMALNTALPPAIRVRNFN
jgi:chemotaxis protein MotA